MTTTEATVHDIELKTLSGKPASMADFTGKVVLAVNVASKCGLTPQYEGLQALYERYRDRGFAIAGFPCNQFFFQEPGQGDEIQEFCKVNYGVTFPLFEKLNVKGRKAHPLYKVLSTTKDDHGKAGNVTWNFEKFLIDAQGRPVRRFRPQVQPEAEEVVQAIEELLGG